jgi:hypothetical protein
MLKATKKVLQYLSIGAVLLASTTPFAPDAQANSSYRVKMWYEITGSDDGVGDNTLELYGETRINGNIICRFDRGSSGGRRREAGQTLDCGETVINGASMTVNGNLMDADGGSSDDPVFRMSPRVVPLQSGRTSSFRHRFPGGEGATLHIRMD